MLSPDHHLPTRDDHDFGLNDGDRTMPTRNASKEAFLDFFDASPTDPRRFRSGVYSTVLLKDATSKEKGGSPSRDAMEVTLV